MIDHKEMLSKWEKLLNSLGNSDSNVSLNNTIVPIIRELIKDRMASCYGKIDDDYGEKRTDELYK